MVAHTYGPFDYYDDIYAGVTGDSLRAAVDPVDLHVLDLVALGEELRGDEREIVKTTEGAILESLNVIPLLISDRATGLAAKGQFAAACTRRFAAGIDTFDTAVNGLNLRYNSMANAARHDPDTLDGDQPMSEVLSGFRSYLQPEYNSALETLDAEADEVAAILKTGPTDEVLREFIRNGFLPLTAATLFPTLTLTDADLRAARSAAVTAMIARLQAEGLLDDDDPDGFYRKWLENAVKRGVSINDIVEIARDHDITPSDFEVLDDLEEVTDPDGKSYFILPTDISGDDARRAALMTYILSAGTDYGSANYGDTDFAETPYSSDEIARIIERQRKNEWSYSEDVGFVHGNGGRLATTPNGIMMGLGGNGLQDLYSMNGGTTFGDSFMLNIDDPDDPRAALAQIIRSGESAVADDHGEPVPRNDHLDLDRLLHHEEIHSQQWADEGRTTFIFNYLNESVDVDWKGWGPFRAPIPHTTEGKDNKYESEAGLTDGGYHE